MLDGRQQRLLVSPQAWGERATEISVESEATTYQQVYNAGCPNMCVYSSPIRLSKLTFPTTWSTVVLQCWCMTRPGWFAADKRGTIVSGRTELLVGNYFAPLLSIGVRGSLPLRAKSKGVASRLGLPSRLGPRALLVTGRNVGCVELSWFASGALL